MGMDSGRNRVLCAIAGTVARPNAAFQTISDLPGRYLVSSVAIFAAVCIASSQSPATAWLESDGGALGGSASEYARSFIHSSFQNFMFIAVLFWIGGRCGENRGFKDMFPVLSYCMIPLMVLGAAAPAWAHFVFPGLAHVGGQMGGDPLAGFAFFMIQNAFTVPFMAWAFVLFVKATKVSRGLETGRAVGVVAEAAVATYIATIAFTIFGGIFVPFAWF